ncbi:DUF6098 family protein [Streptomyces collinus]|uniref:DUF6098 family protein n=1 Tax=Streptomyces collinus TaxID=42684 RepID=UPI0033C67A3D
MSTYADLPTVTGLEELTRLVTSRRGLYVRWSLGPARDLPQARSTDDLTGLRLPGLSASSLDIEAWWGGRPATIWVARRLYDYCHLPRLKDPRTRPWLLHGREAARGPDNEPLVTDVEPLGWISDRVTAQAHAVITDQPGRWGSLARNTTPR